MPDAIYCIRKLANLLLGAYALKEYSLEIYEWSGTSWKPYIADDVQVQFYMMSPYVLKTLSNDQKVCFLGVLHTSVRVESAFYVDLFYLFIYFLVTGPLFDIIQGS